MKKIKIVIFLCIVLFLSGCSVEYDLTIYDDNTISEKVVASEKTKRMESLTNLKDKQAVTYLYDTFKRENEDIEFNYRNESSDTIATAYTSHKSIEDYSNKFSSDIFEKVNIKKEGKLVTLTAKQSNLLGENSSYNLIYDQITINIEVPFKVIENNADSQKGNTYTWNVSKTKNLKDIKLVYEESSQKEKLNIKINDNTYNINYGIIVISVIIICVGLIIAFVYIKNKKNNVL